jgi:hypothetical protein
MTKFVGYKTDWDMGLEVNLEKFELQLRGDNSLVGNDENSLYGITFGEEGVDKTMNRDWCIKGLTADVTADGDIDVRDMAAILNIILGK